MDEYSDKPYITDVAKIIGIHKENARHNIVKYGLTEYINKSFGSHYEHDIYVSIKQYIDEKLIILHDKSILDPQELDIYIPSKHLAIEFNGTYWHSDVKVDRYYHQRKTIECAKKGIQLIHIFEYEWNDEDTQRKLKSLIKSKITTPEITLDANNCIVNTVPLDEANTFLNLYSLTNKTPSSINIGLYNEDTLITLLSVNKLGGHYELRSYCTRDNVEVTDGLKVLYTSFVSAYNPNLVLLTEDISKFSGNAYINIGFTPLNNNCITEPNYSWVNYSNEQITKEEANEELRDHPSLKDSTQTIDEIMDEMGYSRVYTCGELQMQWEAV